MSDNLKTNFFMWPDDPQYHCNTNVNEIGGLANNQTIRIKGECAQATCKDNKQIQITGCSPVGAPPGCVVLPGDLNKPFPECCFIMKCE
nr:unnamed protein product [Callosobruchus chinensis]